MRKWPQVLPRIQFKPLLAESIHGEGAQALEWASQGSNGVIDHHCSLPCSFSVFFFSIGNVSIGVCVHLALNLSSSADALKLCET